MEIRCENMDCIGNPQSVVVYEGKLWFVAPLITKMLGYAKAYNILKLHCPSKIVVSAKALKEKGVPLKHSPSTSLISVTDALKLVMRSDHVEGDRMRDDFVHRIIPHLYANYGAEMDVNNFDASTLRSLYHTIGEALLRQEGHSNTRIIGESQIKRVWK